MRVSRDRGKQLGSGGKLREVKVLLFDLDGTLIDTVDLIYSSFRHAVSTVLGKELPRQELLKNLGRPLIFQMRYFSENHASELVKVYDKHNLAHHDALVKEYPGTRKVLSQLKERGYRFGVVTSKRRALSLRGLRICRLDDLIDVVVAMEDTVVHKPDPFPVRFALEKLAASPNQTLFVGDSPFDIEAGKRAGTCTAAALWGPFGAEALESKFPDLKLKNLAQLLEILLPRVET